jgi:hypothetical protein
MFFLSKGIFKKITKDRNKHPDVFLNVKLKKTVIVQVDEIKEFNRGNTVLLLLDDSKYRVVVNLDSSNFGLLKENARSYLKIGSIIIIREYTYKVIKLEERENPFDFFTILCCLIIGHNEVETKNEGAIFFEDSYKKKIKNEVLSDAIINETLSHSKKEYAGPFMKFNELVLKSHGDIITTICLLTNIENLKEIIPKTKKSIKIRNFFVSDDTMSNVKVAIWGTQAEDFNFKCGDMLILSKIKIVHYNGVLTLSIQWGSDIEKLNLECINKLERAKELKDLWQSLN